MQRYFTQRLPVGTPVGQAHEVLKSEGFDILATRRNTPFEESGGRVRQNVNYVSSERIDGFIFVRVWHVWVFFNNDKVTEIFVQMREVGP